jgi:hypothetical protein
VQQSLEKCLAGSVLEGVSGVGDFGEYSIVDETALGLRGRNGPVRGSLRARGRSLMRALCPQSFGSPTAVTCWAYVFVSMNAQAPPLEVLLNDMGGEESRA